MGCTQSTERQSTAKSDPTLVLSAESMIKYATTDSAADTPPLEVMTKEQYQSRLAQFASKGSLSDVYNVEKGELGRGQFAVVHKCTKKANGNVCAVKLIDINNTSEERLFLEIDILQKIKGHPNIVCLYDVFVTSKEVQLVMELVVGGELFDHLVKQGPYSEAAAAHHMRRIISAVDYLHRIGIVHRDLKPENLLLTSKDPRFAEVKVADFGLARAYSQHAMQTVCGTWAYCAPEVRNDPVGYGHKVDVWSCGVIMFVLIAAFHPFDPMGDSTQEEMWACAERGDFSFNDPAWKGVSMQAMDLISNMIVVDPERRLDCEEVLAHPWLVGSQHSAEPLSPVINRKLNEVKARYRSKVAGASKAVAAAMLFASAGRKKSAEDENAAQAENVVITLEKA